MTITPDITAEVKFLTTDQGGRKGPTQAGHFGCPMKLGGDYHDCRLLLNEAGPFSPGETRIVGIKFLDADGVRAKLAVDVEFELWEGKTIGRGKVISMDI